MKTHLRRLLALVPINAVVVFWGMPVVQYTPEPLVLKMLALVGFALVAGVAMYRLYFRRVWPEE